MRGYSGKSSDLYWLLFQQGGQLQQEKGSVLRNSYHITATHNCDGNPDRMIILFESQGVQGKIVKLVTSILQPDSEGGKLEFTDFSRRHMD